MKHLMIVIMSSINTEQFKRHSRSGDAINMSFPSPPATFAWPAQFCAFVTAATYVASVVTGNVSQVDRLWTFLPTIYTAYFALLPLWPRSVQPFWLCPYVPDELADHAEDYSPRAIMMLSLAVLWMFR
jgi:hypothetical protein